MQSVGEMLRDSKPIRLMFTRSTLLAQPNARWEGTRKLNNTTPGKIKRDEKEGIRPYKLSRYSVQHFQAPFGKLAISTLIGLSPVGSTVSALRIRVIALEQPPSSTPLFSLHCLPSPPLPVCGKLERIII
jgi:hypothetical protein